MKAFSLQFHTVQISSNISMTQITVFRITTGLSTQDKGKTGAELTVYTIFKHAPDVLITIVAIQAEPAVLVWKITVGLIASDLELRNKLIQPAI